MKRLSYFLLGLLCGAGIFTGTAVLANSDVLARLTSQVFFFNNEKIELEAYNINDYNYVRLRDAARIFGVNIEYDEQTDSVIMGDKTEKGSNAQTNNAEYQQSDRIDGMAYSREDFSQQANPAIFNDVYTREAYNAFRQTIVDKDEIVKGTDESGYNPNYHYAHFIDKTHTFNSQGKTIKAFNTIAGDLFGYYNYSFGFEPYIKNIYEYPGYTICKIQIHDFFEPANKATDGFINSIRNLSDREKVKKIADYVSDRIVYKDGEVAGMNNTFTSTEPVNGVCGAYSNAFTYLCSRIDLPCLNIDDREHSWNEVYVDGKWYTADISYYDVARTDEMLLRTTYQRTDPNKAKTDFAKELLVPGSTKQ